MNSTKLVTLLYATYDTEWSTESPLQKTTPTTHIPAVGYIEEAGNEKLPTSSPHCALIKIEISYEDTTVVVIRINYNNKNAKFEGVK